MLYYILGASIRTVVLKLLKNWIDKGLTVWESKNKLTHLERRQDAKQIKGSWEMTESVERCLAILC